MQSLTVVLPAYNEGQYIFAHIQSVCSQLGDWLEQVIVVDDGSQDDTFVQAKRAQDAGLPVEVLQLPVNRGKGAALMHGAMAAKSEWLAFLDADLEISPEYLPKMMAAVQHAGADICVGVRRQSDFPALRRWASRSYRFLVAWLFDLHVSDTQTGIKLLRRTVVKQIRPRLRVSRFAFDVEWMVAALRLGFRIIEFPVAVHYQRQGGWGRIRPAQTVGMAVDTLITFYRASFWRWLRPGMAAKFWMLALALGIWLSGVGFGKILTPVVLKSPWREIFYYLALQFLPHLLRDVLVLLAGVAIMVVALIQLNKILLRAFARKDEGDLAGMLRKDDQ